MFSLGVLELTLMQCVVSIVWAHILLVAQVWVNGDADIRGDGKGAGEAVRTPGELTLSTWLAGRWQLG